MEVEIVETVDALPWDALTRFTGSPLDFSRGVLKAVEASLWGDLKVYYLLVRCDQSHHPLAFSPVYVGTNLNINALLPLGLQRLQCWLVEKMGNAAKIRFGLAGSIISDRGWIPMAPEVEVAHVVPLFLKALDTFYKEQKVKIGVIKDIHERFPTDAIEMLVRDGFVQTYSLPSVTVNTHYSSFEAYLKGLKKNARKHCRKVLRSAYENFTFRRVDDYRDLVDVLYPLFRATYLNARYQFEESLPSFVAQAAQSINPATEVILCEKAGQPVGALMNFYEGDQQLNKRIGLDYAQPETPVIYASLMYEGIRSAIERGVKCVHLGQSTYVPKLRLGGELEDLFFFVKPYDVVTRMVLGLEALWLRRYRKERVLQLFEQGVSV